MERLARIEETSTDEIANIQHVIVQGVVFVELGLALLVLHAFPAGNVRTAIGAALAVSALISAGIQHKLRRDWKIQQKATLRRNYRT